MEFSCSIYSVVTFTYAVALVVLILVRARLVVLCFVIPGSRGLYVCVGFVAWLWVDACFCVCAFDVLFWVLLFVCFMVIWMIWVWVS